MTGSNEVVMGFGFEKCAILKLKQENQGIWNALMARQSGWETTVVWVFGDSVNRRKKTWRDKINYQVGCI